MQKVSQIPSKLTVCGDTHGQYYDLCNIFKLNGQPSAENPYLFNGDFVDRGSWGLEVFLTLLGWWLHDPKCMYLTRGNHETKNMNELYGFEGEVKHKGMINKISGLLKIISRAECLPLIPDAFPVSSSRISYQQAGFGDAWRPSNGRQYRAR